jgi:hypothetical protein
MLLATFTLTKAFNIFPLKDNKKGLYYLLSMVIVYTYKGVNYFKCKNSKDLSSCSLV